MAIMNMIDDKLYELQKVCNRYKEIDCLADWVLYAIHRHIYSNKATRKFEDDFINYYLEAYNELYETDYNDAEIMVILIYQK